MNANASATFFSKLRDTKTAGEARVHRPPRPRKRHSLQQRSADTSKIWPLHPPGEDTAEGISNGGDASCFVVAMLHPCSAFARLLILLLLILLLIPLCPCNTAPAQSPSEIDRWTDEDHIKTPAALCPFIHSPHIPSLNRVESRLAPDKPCVLVPPRSPPNLNPKTPLLSADFRANHDTQVRCARPNPFASIPENRSSPCRFDALVKGREQGEQVLSRATIVSCPLERSPDRKPENTNHPAP